MSALLVVLIAPPAAGAADFTSAGGDGDWSTGARWAGGVAPSGAVGALIFPSAACAGACGNQQDDVSGLTAATMSFRAPHSANGWGVYGSAAAPLTLTGGLDAAFSDTGLSRDVAASLGVPIVLGADNTWTVDAANLYTTSACTPSCTFGVSGNHSLALNLTNGAALRNFGGRIEVGPVTVTGGGTLDLERGNGTASSLNGTTNSPVTITGSSLQVVGGPGVTVPVGPLTATNTQVQVATGKLAVSGAVFNAGSTLKLQTNSTGTEAGKDYSALTSTGPVELGGSQLTFYASPPLCSLPTGTVLTLVSTTGPLTGTFANAPEGGVVDCAPPATVLRINYIRTGPTQVVTATIQPAQTRTTTTPPPTTTTTMPPTRLPPHPGDPGALKPPTVTGVAKVGQTLTGSHAMWPSPPRQYGGRWQRCSTTMPSSCVDIDDTAYHLTYLISAQDLGKRMRLREAAFDSRGQRMGPAFSSMTDVVQRGTSSVQLRAALQKIGAPPRTASVGSVLAKSATLTFKAPTAGALSVGWYKVPAGARMSTNRAVLVAVGTRKVTQAGKVKLVVRPTAAGKRLLGAAKKAKRSLKLTSKSSFTPKGGAAVSRVAKFQLRR